MEQPAQEVTTPRAAARGDMRAALRRATAGLPLAERLHLAIRFSSVPWDRILPAFETRGPLLDIGCGPGLLAFLLALSGFRGEYLGVDPDERKIGRALRWPGETPGRSFRAGTVEAAPRGSVAQAALVDILYLLPKGDRPALVAACAERLAPGGLFVAVTSGGGPGWKRRLDRLQETAAVALGITKGAAVEPCDGAEVAAYFASAGLTGVWVTDIGSGYLHGFDLVTGRRR